MENKEQKNSNESLDQIPTEISALSETDHHSESGGSDYPHQTDESAVKKKKKGSGLLGDLLALVLRIGWISLILAILLLVICGITVNSGDRMSPAFHDRDVIIFYRLSKDIQAGEVVVYRGPNDQVLLGRVVAKGGDTVDIDKNGLKINGYYQTEHYKQGETVLFEEGVSLPVTLRPGEFFVLCDMRAQGGDSRNFGPISSDHILGRVMLSIRQRDF